MVAINIIIISVSIGRSFGGEKRKRLKGMIKQNKKGEAHPRAKWNEAQKETGKSEPMKWKGGNG